MATQDQRVRGAPVVLAQGQCLSSDRERQFEAKGEPLVRKLGGVALPQRGEKQGSGDLAAEQQY